MATDDTNVSDTSGPDDDSSLFVPELEFDENVPPRPEDEIADVVRAEPDVADHSVHPAATDDVAG